MAACKTQNNLYYLVVGVTNGAYVVKVAQFEKKWNFKVMPKRHIANFQ